MSVPTSLDQSQAAVPLLPPVPGGTTTFKERHADHAAIQVLKNAGISPLLARLYANRGITDPTDVLAGYDALLPVSALKNCDALAARLVDCHKTNERVLIIADYDCDGATACAVLLTALQSSGMNVGYLVPDRSIHGYGLTPEIVNEAAALTPPPRHILTVDNGISSHAGVDRAREIGISVMVTDHHLAPPVLPNADIIVNPNQPGDDFSSKHIAGCGVAWYVAKSYHNALSAMGIDPEFDPEELLPLVAIGTVADIVTLDKNNRILVREGLRRLRAGACSRGIQALTAASKRQLNILTCQDIGFALGPRLNAAGRLASMHTGIECLFTEDNGRARLLASLLDSTNEARKVIQTNMTVDAEAMVDMVDEKDKTIGASVVVFDASFHKGVVGVVASKIKDRCYRPTFVMATTASGDLVGSGRSIPGFHLKHALDEIHISNPGLLLKFGGHAMAAGVTVAKGRLEKFKAAFDAVCKSHLTPDLLGRTVEHDGKFPEQYLTMANLREINGEVWGAGFTQPVFVDDIVVTSKRLLGDGKHLKLDATLGETHVDVVAFFMGDRFDDINTNLTVAHQPGVNTFNRKDSLQLQISDFPGLPCAATKADLPEAPEPQERRRRQP